MELGLWDDVIFVPTYPFFNRAGEFQDDNYSIAPINPLDKVPTLILDDGRAVLRQPGNSRMSGQHEQIRKKTIPG